MIHTLTGRVRDLAGHEATRTVDVDVGGILSASWGPKILQWIQPLPESLGPIIVGTPSTWKAKAAALNPGETLYLEPGNYGNPGEKFDWARAGSPVAPITISGIPGQARPMIRGMITMRGPYQRWSRSIFDGPTGNTGGPGPNGEAILLNLDGTELEVSDCEVRHDYWHAGIGANNTSFYRILRNYIHDNGGYNGDYTDAQNNTSHGMYVSPSSYGLMANNLVEHNDAKGIMGRHDSHHLIIVHNTIVANGRFGSESYEQSHDWVWANNIFLNNGNVKGGVGLSMGGVGPFLNRRNVFWHNNTNGTGTYTGTGTTSEPKVADPHLVRPAVYTPQQDLAPNWDHRPLAGSPVIGYGDPDYAMPTDIDGVLRSGRFDCGAYQG